MGKTGGGSSWLTAVKRAFRSPTKDNSESNSERCSGRPHHHHGDHYHQQQNKKREKRGWLFRKPTNHEATQQTKKQNVADNDNNCASEIEQSHAIAVSIATAKAAEAADVRLVGSYYAREQNSATVIQTAFRGYLARRALRALKGLVKLQALVRGHNVRKQAKMTLQCMQALVRVQSRVLDQRVRQLNDGSSRKSTFGDKNSLWESRSLQYTCDRKSLSRYGSSIVEEWDEYTHTVEEAKAIHQLKKESALKRERNLSQAFSQQMLRIKRNQSFGNEEEMRLGEQPQWVDRWMPAKPWENSKGRASTDQKDTFYKTVEMDNTSQAQAPYSYLPLTNCSRPNRQHQRSNSQCPLSPLYRAHQNLAHTPSPSKTRSVQVPSASPSYHRSQTPSLRSNYFYNGMLSQQKTTKVGGSVPNYMTETESTRARSRSQSAPRQRPFTLDRERAVRPATKKRLSYPAPDLLNNGHHMNSPSFKRMSGLKHMGVEQQSNYSSCYTDSLVGERSSSSTTDLRRWW